MLTRSDTPGRYDAVWREAEPYMRARKNDVHIPLSFAFAQALLKLHPTPTRISFRSPSCCTTSAGGRST
jgi:archaeosine-15-forming tRNA-guanine transglycosylase